MSQGPVTTFTTATHLILSDIVKTLRQKTRGLGVYKFLGSNVRDLLEQIPEIKRPGAIVVYRGSKYYTGSPARKESQFSVFVVADAPRLSEIDVEDVLYAKVTEIIAALDWTIVRDDAKLEVVGDDPYDLDDPAIAAVEIQFDIKDF
jgi:hypothetical protein